MLLDDGLRHKTGCKNRAISFDTRGLCLGKGLATGGFHVNLLSIVSAPRHDNLFTHPRVLGPENTCASLRVAVF